MLRDQQDVVLGSVAVLQCCSVDIPRYLSNGAFRRRTR